MIITYANGLSAAKLYSAIFGTPASQTVVDSYENGKASASTVASAMWADAAKASGYASYNYDDNTVLVHEIYKNVLGRTEAEITADAAGVAYWTAQLDSGAVTAEKAVVSILSGVDATNDPYGDATHIDTELAKGKTINLVDGVDNVAGTANNDTINAYIYDNNNSLESGDMIDGGTGTDTLNADIGNSQAFAITAHTTSVENFTVRAQSNDTENAENNTQGAVQIDAERMVGTDKYTSEESRADVIIEDVRIDANQITKDITIAMVSTDAGAVDMGVYFDQHSLRAAQDVTSGSTLNLELMDTKNAVNGNFLQDNPYNAVKFSLGTVQYTLSSDDIRDATTYTGLLTAINAQIAADSTLSTTVTAAISGNFTARDTDTGTQSTGSVITLTNSGDDTFTVGSWIASEGVPANSSLHTAQDILPPAVAGNLITSTIILDDVGSKSMGGDLIVGGISTGITSDSMGVERFDITVERSSELQEIQSTNNTLQEVYIVNGTENGNLVVAGDTNGDNDLPNSDAATAGFTDVRLLDASAMIGSVNINADISNNSVSKYLNPIDTDVLGAETSDNLAFAYNLGTSNDTLSLTLDRDMLVDSDFTLAIDSNAGADTITFDLTGATDNANWYATNADQNNITITTDAGDDTVTTTGEGDVIINTGSDNDTVYTDNSGGLAITAGITTDIAGLSATAAVTAVAATPQTAGLDGILGTADDVVVVAAVAAVAAGTSNAIWTSNNAVSSGTINQINDMEKAATTSFAGIKGQLQVTFKGITSDSTTSTSDTGTSTWTNIGYNATNFTTSAYDIRQALKDAVNNDAELSKLLVVKDGPENTYVIESLIDGTMLAGDISIDFRSPLAYDIARNTTDGSLELTSSETTSAATLAITVPGTTAMFASNTAATAYGDGVAAITTTAAVNVTATTATAAFSTGNAVAVALDDGSVAVTGAASTAVTDNTIDLGTGTHDIVVLSTGTSNDTVDFNGYNLGYTTIVNFDNAAVVSLNTDDTLDFSAYNGTAAMTYSAVTAAAIPAAAPAAAAVYATNTIYVEAAGATSDALAAATQYTSAAATAVDSLLFKTHYSDANVADVYELVSTTASTAITATLIGTVDMSNVTIASLTLADFS